MQIQQEMKKIAGRKTAAQSPPMKDAKILKSDEFPDMYAIRFADGRTASKVPGREGLSPGDSISVGSYPGSANRYVVVGTGYNSGEDDNILEVEV